MFATGATLTVQEVWHERVWLEFPETVERDDGDLLATVQRSGTPLTFHDHPEGRHPWAGLTHWSGTTVLKLRRTGLWYAVWKFFDDAGRFLHWYVNFERPYVRRPDGIDVDDLELDLVLHADGRREWKDVECLDARLAEARFSADDLRHVLAAAPVVIDLLDRDERWWAPWDDWTP